MSPILLHVGFSNQVVADQVTCLLDYRVPSVKRIVKSARDERPRSVMDLTRGRKSMSLIVLTGDRYVISAIPLKTLAKRMGVPNVEE